jgi:hypothetical protein
MPASLWVPLHAARAGSASPTHLQMRKLTLSESRNSRATAMIRGTGAAKLKGQAAGGAAIREMRQRSISNSSQGFDSQVDGVRRPKVAEGPARRMGRAGTGGRSG